MPSSDPNLGIQVLLAEYASLKTEIYGRSRDQLLCVINSLIALGGLFSGIAISGGKLTVLALIIPWILSVFGIIWCDHHTAIHYIAAYIRRIESKEFISLMSNNQFFSNYVGWENWFNTVRRTKKELPQETFTTLHKVLPLIYFFIPSLIAIIYYLYENFDNSISWLGFQFGFKFGIIPEGIILLIDIFLIFAFLAFYVDASISTSFEKMTNTELETLQLLINSNKDQNLIFKIFKKLTGIPMDENYLNKIKRIYKIK